MNQLNSRSFGFKGCFPVDCVGEGNNKRGGMCMLWREPFDLSLISFSQHHISVSVKCAGVAPNWICSGIYGWPEHTQKWRTWQLLKSIYPGVGIPWICMGDYNEIMWLHEKKGGNLKSWQDMEQFRTVVGECELSDLGFSGHRFTWTNGRSGEDNIQERLDRVLANETWKNIFPSWRVSHLHRVKSDHTPLLVNFDNVDRCFSHNRRKKKFRFEKMWLEHQDCEKIVKQAWSQQETSNFMRKLNHCGEVLQAWDKNEFGQIRKKLTLLSDKLAIMQAKKQTRWVIRESKNIEEE
ncbi:hypothetical protein DH2020_001397 [Rehmannia glutinosa]|uniref:Endonuclease/exonuclease/phosphatase domain-containing protein n=1 Tax=Rehmannia glutinosa TaxID=99300 RepID=A0ABR0XZM7_REHGL